MVLYCFIFIHFYNASDSMSPSEALPTTAIYSVGFNTLRRYSLLEVQIRIVILSIPEHIVVITV